MNKNHTAIVYKFNQQRVCAIAAVGSPKTHYDSSEVYWIEKSEDEYGLMNLPKNITAVLWREDWLRGRVVEV
jgi:hypothetical protein